MITHFNNRIHLHGSEIFVVDLREQSNIDKSSMKQRRDFRSFVMAMLVVTAGLFAGTECKAIGGVWRGELLINGVRLPLVFNFSQDADGSTRCTMDSPMQNAKGIGTQVLFCSNDSVLLLVSSLGVTYRGKVSSNRIEGEFVQMGYSFPLTLSPEQPLSERRPQTPVPPFPYQSTDTTFVAADGVRLAGTLTMPAGAKKNVPAVVMVTGSGPQNRDEEVFEHRPFAVLADWLARHGIASFRYDDRGTARSEGNFAAAGLDIFKSDAEAALQFLKSVKGIGKAGVLGHSEGGTIALMLAADGKADYVVSLAGLATDGKDMLIAQNLHSLKKLGATEQQQTDVIRLLNFCFNDIIAGREYTAIDVETYAKEHGLDIPAMVMVSFKRNLQAAKGTYFRQLLQVSPKGWLPKISCPVFALNGTFDTQVDCTDNLKAVRELVKGSRVKEYTGLNHFFQHCTTGEPTEYFGITETISPEVLDDIVAYIRSL